VNITIRAAEILDFEQMLEIYKELDEIHRLEHPELFKEPEGDSRPLEYVKNQIKDENKYLVVAELKNKIIGFAECFINESSSFPVIRKRSWVQLDTIAISKKHQNQGIGKLLLHSVMSWAKTRNIHRIELNVYSFNASAMEFYSKAGFKTISSKMYLEC
jgi:diamine N-acetyltransferase